MALDSLPSEVLLHIATYIDTPDSDAALALVNRRLLDVFKPSLYRAAISVDLPDITIVAAAKGNLETLKVAATYGAHFRGRYPLPPLDWVKDKWRLQHYKTIRMRETWEPDLVVPDDYDAGPIPQEACWATPLAMAARNGHYHVVQWLLKQNVGLEDGGRFLCDCMPLKCRHPFDNSKCHPNYPGVQVNPGHLKLCRFPAWTPLHYAICNRHTSIARLLLASGASYHNVRMPNRFHKYPLFPAVESPDSVDIYELALSYHEMKRRIFGLDDGNGLLDQGDFGLQEVDGGGNTSIPPSSPLTLQTTGDGTPELAETENLVEMASYEDPFYIPALHIAASSGAKPIMTHLVKNVGVDILSQDGYGGTVLHYAVFAPQPSNAVNQALSLGADPRVGFFWGMESLLSKSFDALDWAIQFRVEQAVDAFLAWPGCDLAWCHMPCKHHPSGSPFSQSRRISRPSKETRIKHMIKELSEGNFPPLMTPDWDYGMQCFKLFSPRLFSATIRQSTGKFQKENGILRRELERAFFCALQTDCPNNEDLSWFKWFDLDEIAAVSENDETLTNRWGLSFKVALYPEIVSIGALALYNVVIGNAKLDSQLDRICWLLHRGANPCPPSRMTQRFSPILHLLGSLRPSQYWSDRVEGTIAIINVLGVAGGWVAFARDAMPLPQGLLTMSAHYVWVYRRVEESNKKLAEKIHSMLEESMPSELLAIFEEYKIFR
ncbi:hypothetical protein CTA2_7306 [Colletotrichum tanaceti]|uniref:F-box domain-containing protein n=1 Tax=Colletotrichum tanaceti TaxID=1306861 RepID=A0A4U6XSH2_9PEZI|nr:hypothetical protein CTA2_7306 [Colletotrichum tanaceti]TKW58812.1 hypothetical protein CTA1_8617 [Colletotrichum tanaceti]